MTTDNDAEELHLLRAAEYAAVEPWAMLAAVRATDGRIIDFRYHDVNPIAAQQQRRPREELIGHSVARTLPEVARTGLIAHYAHCVETGEPLILDDFSYTGRTLDSEAVEPRRYEIRGVRVDADFLSLTWRDVSRRYLAAQELAESAERYRLLIENSTDVVAHFRDGRLVWVSASVAAASGAPPQHWIGRPVESLVPAEDATMMAEALDRLRDGGSVVRRVRIFDVDGATHWWEAHLANFHDADGRPDGIIGSFRPVDDRVAIEQALEEARTRQAESDALYRQSMRSAAVGTCLADLEGRLTEVNDAFCRFFGYDADTLRTMTWQELTDPNYLQADLDHRGAVLAGHIDSYRMTKQFIHADGHRIWGDLSVGCVRHPDGKVKTFIGQIVDITETVEARNELARYRQLIEASTVGTAMVNMDGSMAMLNQAMCDLAGYDMDAALGMTWMQAIPEPHLQTLRGAVEDLVSGRVSGYRGRHVFIHADGQPRWIDMSLSCMRKPNGQNEFIVFQSVDVTGEVHAEEQLEQAHRLLAASADSMLNPQLVLGAVRDPGGRVVDLRILRGNRAAFAYLGVSSQDALAHNTSEVQPNLVRSGLLARYAACLDDGQPVVLDDFPLADTGGGTDRRFDIRAYRAGTDTLTLTWSDVTERYRSAQRLAESELHYRLIATNSADVVSKGRDDTTLEWVSPSVEAALGAPPRHWVGLSAVTLVHPDDLPLVAEVLNQADEGKMAIRRLRVVDAHQQPRWAEFHVARFHDADGKPDGFISAFRIVDDEVAAEQALDEARRKQADADAIYRRMMENSAVATCLARTDGTLLEVNDAYCRFFGYDAETVLTKTWVELTAPEYRQADLNSMADLAAGRTNSYRVTKQYLHADGHRIWGDLFVGCLRRSDSDVQTIIVQIVDVTAEMNAREELEQSRDLMEASLDSMLDPQILLEAVRDAAGEVEDFRILGANRSAAAYLHTGQEDLEGRCTTEMFPNLLESGLLERYTRCLADGEPVILSDFAYFNELLDDARRYDIRASRAGDELLTLTWSDVTERFEDAERLAASEAKYRVLAENASDVVTHIRDGKFVWVSPSIEKLLGAPAEYWIGREVSETLPADGGADHAERMAILKAGGSIQRRVQLLSRDGTTHWVDIHSTPFYDDEGRRDGFTGSLRLIDAEVAAEQKADEARRRQARADALYRRSMDNAAVGTCLADLEGRLTEVNDAMCRFFGYDADMLRTKTWQELTAPDYLQADLDQREAVLAGDIESYRMTKQFIHADGRPIWGDLYVSCLRDAGGQVETFIGQIADITAQVEADERNVALTRMLSDELASAASYMRSIMPSELTGPVEVSSRYLPSQEIGGDCFDYRWLDDDHLLCYLIDVSGHGVEPALLAISVHNLLRSGSLPLSTLRAPEAVLRELNQLFQMENHSEHYFTMWVGVYEISTRTLRYASAGAPPALAFSPVGGAPTELATESAPVGTFEDTAFGPRSVHVEPGSRILVYSDGAYELAVDGHRQLSLPEFIGLCTRVNDSPDPSLDALISELRSIASAGVFTDDCSMIQLVFN